MVSKNNSENVSKIFKKYFKNIPKDILKHLSFCFCHSVGKFLRNLKATKIEVKISRNLMLIFQLLIAA